MKRVACFAIASLALLQAANGFQFMSNWKLPVKIDFEQEAAVKEKFGDKSKSFVLVLAALHLSRHEREPLLTRLLPAV